MGVWRPPHDTEAYILTTLTCNAQGINVFFNFLASFFIGQFFNTMLCSLQVCASRVCAHSFICTLQRLPP